MHLASGFFINIVWYFFCFVWTPQLSHLSVQLLFHLALAPLRMPVLSVLLWQQVLVDGSLFWLNLSLEGLFLCYVQLISVKELLRRPPSQDGAQYCFSRVHVYYPLITAVLKTFGSLPLWSLFDRTTVEVVLGSGAPLRQVGIAS